MDKRLKKILISTILISFTFTGSIFAEKLIPSYKKFWVQSAKEYGKSWKGVWDISGHPKKFKKGQKLQVWEMKSSDKRDKDRQFYFIHLTGDWYRIKSRLKGAHSLDVSDGYFKNGTPVQFKLRNPSITQKFKMKYLGRGKWKIYTKNNYVVTLDGRRTKNGTKVKLWKDHNGSWTEWMLIEPGARRAFAPRRSSLENYFNQKKKSKSSISLKKALMYTSNDYGINTFFPNCSFQQIKVDKQLLIQYINGLDDAKKALRLNKIINATIKNDNRLVRYTVYRTLDQANLKIKGFVANLGKMALKKTIKRAKAQERSNTKRILTSIENKLR